MKSLFRLFALAVLVVAPLAMGCSGEMPKGTLNGTVSLDGTPLKEGVINFTASDGKSGSASANIKDGAFTASVPATEMKVSISASKVLGKKKMYDTPDSPTIDETVELIPAKYNASTTLKVTVKAGTQSEKFDLVSK